MLFFIDSEKHFDEVFNFDILKYEEELKRNGVIRAIGASSHNSAIAKKMAETGVIELLMFSVNPGFDMISAEIDAVGTLDKGFDENVKSVMLKMDEKQAELYRVWKLWE